MIAVAVVVGVLLVAVATDSVLFRTTGVFLTSAAYFVSVAFGSVVPVERVFTTIAEVVVAVESVLLTTTAALLVESKPDISTHPPPVLSLRIGGEFLAKKRLHY